MCGIAGYWRREQVDSSVALEMAQKIASRGPDDFGVWCAADTGLALAHRRLSILDLSPAGHQPMTSFCGRYKLVFNGEIYNHKILRAELEAQFSNIVWRGHSDTETLLAALVVWGIKLTLERLNGMFAFALWDESEKVLLLARDRMGEKPLYYGKSGDTFLFGSELKALSVHPDWDGEVNRDVLALYLRHNCVPSPYCIYKGIAKLPPAHFVVIRDAGQKIDEPQCYWNLAEIAVKGVATTKVVARSVNDLTVSFDSLLRDAVGIRMEADVSLGAFLSGGYDSTAVTALMQAQSASPIKTFSIGFNDTTYNEAHHAKAVAKHLGTDHTELYVTSAQAQSVIPKLPYIYDEPFSDSSQIPTYLVCQMAQKHVTVALSGDGGDELFAGYNRHVFGPGIWRRTQKLPMPVRQLCGNFLNYFAQKDLQALMRLLPLKFRIPGVENKIQKLAEAMLAVSGADFYRSLSSHWKEPGSIVIGSYEPESILTKREQLPDLPELRDMMLYLDQVTYLPDDILTKVDRASMAVSLEARVPFLDHRLVEFAWALPSEYKVKNGEGKWLLREVLHKYVPRELIERPKQGFGIPLAEWLRGPLRDWADELLNEKRLQSEGFFEPAIVRMKWETHLSGKDGWHYHLWDILMFQAWLEANPKAH